LLERAVEDLACGSDEWMACKIFGVARLLAHEHHVRASGSLAGHALRRVSPEGAPAARIHRLAQLLERIQVPANRIALGFAVVQERGRVIVTVARMSCSHSEQSTARGYGGSRHGEAFAPN
jgi:hypothetical protein